MKNHWVSSPVEERKVEKVSMPEQCWPTSGSRDRNDTELMVPHKGQKTPEDV